MDKTIIFMYGIQVCFGHATVKGQAQVFSKNTPEIIGFQKWE